MPKSKVICLAQSKGGTSKTSSTLNLSACLVGMGYKVLALDLDQQASLTISAGVDPLTTRQTMYTLLTDPGCKAEEVLVPTREGFDLMPADIDLAVVEFSIRDVLGREKLLAKKLRPIRDQYDYILVDTPPSFALTTLNGLSAADFLLVPVQPEPLCMHGLRKLVQTFETVQENSNPSLALLGVFITMYDSRLRAHREIVDVIRQDWQDLAFEVMIRRRSNILEATVEGRSIVSIQKNSDLAQDYLALTKEMTRRVEAFVR